MRNALEVTGLVKAFGAVSVLNGVSLMCEPGAIVGLVGRNGSGKTTFIRCVSGQIRSDAGEIVVGGEEFRSTPAWRRARRGLGWTAQDGSPAITLRVSDVLGYADRDWRKALPAVLQSAIESFSERRWRDLSFGERKLAALSVSLARRSTVLLLDEPVAGLSTGMTAIAGQAIKQAASAGAAVIVVEHNRPFLIETANEVVVLGRGQVVFRGDPQSAFSNPTAVEALR